MAVLSSNGCASGADTLLHIDMSYDVKNSEESTRKLVYRIQPKWRENPEQLRLTSFTDGITNTLLKITREEPGATKEEIDRGAILMRAYGNNTDIIIDRNREARSHALLADRGMAPPLLARFNNGLLYGFIPGIACTAQDLTTEPIWRGVARKLGEWHARVPIDAVTGSGAPSPEHTNGHANGHINGNTVGNGANGHQMASRLWDTNLPSPNLWTVLQKWIDVLPTDTEKERVRRDLLQQQVERSFQELDNRDGIGEQGLIVGHCDLLCANVIMLPSPDATSTANAAKSAPVTFIDYEYATPCPAAFDIANHFAEWAGYDCDYSILPTKPVRTAFLCDYLASYNQYARVKVDESVAVRFLDAEIDRYRGMPGLYWGVWGLIQARISQIDFDYASYAETRLGEYWDWRAEQDGSRARDGKNMPLRERRWAQTS